MEREIQKRVEFIKEILRTSGAEGIVYGNSGGKDSALVGILCRKACDNVLGLIMPCGSKRNYEEDAHDAKALAERFGIEYKVIDLSKAKESIIESIKSGGAAENLLPDAQANIAPRLRMTTLYAVARHKNYIVAGTGNRSEGYMGYFTKWGDGAYDFNPIADLTVTEIYEMLKYLNAPSFIIEKAPSAGLYDGQTDEKEMGITYSEIDEYLLYGKKGANFSVIEKFHNMSEHKRKPPVIYGDNNKN
jgi:NAD+ synthase